MRVMGVYSLSSASFSEPVSLFQGLGPYGDLYRQLQMQGWYGTIWVDLNDGRGELSPFKQSQVLAMVEEDDCAQVNLYVPYPLCCRDGQPVERCGVSVQLYQFHYIVNGEGEVELKGISDSWCADSDSPKLTEVSIEFADGRILFEANTSYYDWNSESWKEGLLQLEYVRQQ